MARPIWITTSQTLSTVNENEYFELQLTATNAVTYRVIAGQTPPGIQLNVNGKLQGIPIISNTQSAEKIYNYQFTVRATSSDNLVNDRTFDINVTNIQIPIIVGPDSNLGTYTEGDFVDIQLEYVDSTPGESLEFSIIDGSLPNPDIDPTDEIYPYRLTLSTSGRLTGYIFNQPLASQTTNFVVEIRDSINRSRKSYSITTTQNTSVPRRPILLNQSGIITASKHDNFYSYKFIGYDFDGDNIEYYIENQVFDSSLTGERGFDSSGFDAFKFDQLIAALSTNLIIDPVTGWLYGKLPQVVGIETYRFAVAVRKTVSPFTSSQSKIFSLSTFSAQNENVEWLTDSDLGEVFNGAISELSVSAVSTADPNEPITYRLRPYNPVNPYPVNLPQGLILKDNGLIIGRTSFRYFSLDDRTTTLDGNTTFFDETYNFTIDALDSTGTVLGFRTFNVRVLSRNLEPYENIYIKSLSTPTLRSQYYNLIQSQDWIADENVYRPQDPYFGRRNYLESLFLPGVVPELLSQYATAEVLNHYRKSASLTNLKVARAQDNNFNTTYEVIYADLDDDLEVDSQSVALEIDLLNRLANYYQVQGIDQTSVYPNSFRNMRQRLLETLDLENRGVLPKWMSSVQENGSVLGFVRAVPLVYCQPGTGKVALQDLKNKLDSSTSTGFINTFNFEIDRYHVDQYLSRYYDPVTNAFQLDSETTFDRLTNSATFLDYGGTVDYAVDVPFETINGANLLQLLGYSGIIVDSPETYDAEFNGSLAPVVPAWSAWMNTYAVWYDTGITSLQGTTWTVEREFVVDTAAVYTLAIMNSDSVTVTVNGNTAAVISGSNITNDFTNFTVDVYLVRGRNRIKFVMDIAAGSSVWRFNPQGLAAIIYRVVDSVTETVFTTRSHKDPLISFTTQSLLPGIDGESDIRTGQTLIFRTQDYYSGYPGLELENHGWNDYAELFGNIYDSDEFNEYTVIPGLGQPVNQRSGIWSITVQDDLTITLTFQSAVESGKYFKILRGQTYRNTLLRLSRLPASGHSELDYYEIQTDLSAVSTVFDGGGTRFYEFRDLYLDPNRNDKYVIYPRLGVFE